MKATPQAKVGSQIHVFNPLWNAAGGSEWRALNLYKELRRHTRATFWGSSNLDPSLAAEFDGRILDPRRLSFPRTGTFVFVGVYFWVGRWISLTKPRRVILTYNTPEPEKLDEKLKHFGRNFGVPVELVYCSAELRDAVGLPGEVETSLFDLERFSPLSRTSSEFTIGRLSRAEPAKHHPGDLDLYKRLASKGCRIRVMGATDAMIDESAGVDGLWMLPACVQEAPSFLRDLDCFFYRTSPDWVEPWGRVITEAMACGLPIVAQRQGGYASLIEHGKNGLLFDTEQEAFDLLIGLREDVEMRRSLGAAARATAERIADSGARANIVDFYLR